MIVSRVIRESFTDRVTFYKDLEEVRTGDLGIQVLEEQPACAPA